MLLFLEEQEVRMHDEERNLPTRTRTTRNNAARGTHTKLDTRSLVAPGTQRTSQSTREPPDYGLTLFLSLSVSLSLCFFYRSHSLSLSLFLSLAFGIGFSRYENARYVALPRARDGYATE